MKNGLTLDAPVTKEISSAVAWAIRVVALTFLLYGLTNFASAVIPLIK